MLLSPLRDFVNVFSSSVRYKKSWRVVVLLILVLPFSALLYYWCHTTNSLGLFVLCASCQSLKLLNHALTSFAYLTLFNIGSLLTCLVSIWASKQKPTPKFSYGLERVNVLAVFAATILLVLFGINLVKHSMERVFEPPPVATENMLLGTCLGLAVHLMVTCGVTNKPLVHVAEAATPNWLQNVLNDLGHSICGFSPPLGRLLLSKLDPLALLAVGGAFSVIIAKILIDIDELYLADVAGALFNSSLICGTMVPLSVYSAKILLQTAPEHVLPLLDKSLREASTLDGVLELKNEHFWTIAFGSYAGSLHVRVRRDADEQEVLTQVTSRLASQMNDLTVQVVKDDWTMPSMPMSPPKLPRTPSPHSPTHAHAHSHGGRTTPIHHHSHPHAHSHSHPHASTLQVQHTHTTPAPPQQVV